MKPLLSLAAIAVCATAVAAPTASADSIAYIKDGNVWLSTPDNSRQFQVTTSGGYTDVTQADDGTMIGLNGIRLHRLDRTGKKLADFDTPVSDTRPAGSRVFFGPFDPSLSPDGTKVSYTYYYMTQSQNPTCFPPTCVTTINEGGTGYSHADRQTGWDEPGFRKHSGWRHAVWVDNETTMLSNPTHLPNRDIILDKVGTSPILVHNWTSDTVDQNPHVSGGDITRDKRKMAFQTGENDSTMTVYFIPEFPTSWRDSEPNTDKVHVCYRYSGPDGGKFSQPSFSPDGNQLAWAEGNGVHVAQVPAFGAGCTTDGASPTAPLVIPGASEPDWGPADVPTAAPAAAAQGGTASGAAPRAAAPALRAKVKKAKGGLKVTVSVPSAGKLGATAKAGGRTIARAAAKKVKPGTRTLTLRIKKRTKARRASVTVTFTAPGAAAQKTKLSAKLR